MSNIEPIYEYDTNGNMIHYKNSNGYEVWYERDTNGNPIHYRDSNGVEGWYEYDTNGNLIHFTESSGYEFWYEYDINGNVIDKRTKKKDNTTMSNDKKYIITNGSNFMINNIGGWTYCTDIHIATKFTLADAMSVKSRWEKADIHSDYEIHECICYVGEKYVDKRKTLIEDLERAASKVGYYIQSADIRYTQNIINAAIEYLKEQKD
jgi:YD repeat-containing protein